jgi:hypothetical protein
MKPVLYRQAVIIGLTLMLVESPLLAHHSFAAEFDAAKPVTLTGIVTRFEWMNPHAHLYIDVKETAWACEMASPNVLLRAGWTRNSLKPGDVVTINGFLAKDGSHFLNVRSVLLPDGRTTFSAWFEPVHREYRAAVPPAQLQTPLPVRDRSHWIAAPPSR